MAAPMAVEMPALTPASDFGVEGNCCPLLLQASALGHPSAVARGLVVPWPAGLQCLQGLWVLMWPPVPVGPSSSCAPPGSPALPLPVAPAFAPLGVCAQLGQPQSLPGMVGAEPPGNTWLCRLSCPLPTCTSLLALVRQGLVWGTLLLYPDSRGPCRAQLFSGDRPIPSRRSTLPSLSPQ